MEITGEITKIEEVQKGVSNSVSWTKQNIIIKTEGQYPKQVCLTAFNKVCDSTDTLKVGDTLIAQINLESREYNERWYNEIKMWKFSKS